MGSMFVHSIAVQDRRVSPTHSTVYLTEKELRLKDRTECLLLLALALALVDDIVAVVLSVLCVRLGVSLLLTCACRGPQCAASAA